VTAFEAAETIELVWTINESKIIVIFGNIIGRLKSWHPATPPGGAL
jgi:hypothetical protein